MTDSGAASPRAIGYGELPLKPPIRVGELEIGAPIRDIELPAGPDGVPYTAARLLVRLHRTPLGHVYLGPDMLSAPAVAAEVWRQLGTEINRQRTEAGLPALDALPTDGLPAADGQPGGAPAGSSDGAEDQDDPPVSVVVCTRDRPEGALAAVRGLMALEYPRFELVLVDNAPTSDATKDAVLGEFGSDPRLRYVREPRPGLSRARNRGVAESTAEIIAFTDDDVRVDRWWLHGIVRGFNRIGDVACVTGLIPTAALDNALQLYFDQREAWGSFSEPQIWDLTEHRDDSPLYPYSAGQFGVGANFAITRSALKELDGFDEALGAGTPSGGGEDLDIFTRTILAGHRLVHEPSAIIWHNHRSNFDGLSRQMLSYGSGCTAALFALLLRNGQARRELPVAIIRGVSRVAAIDERTKDNPVLPTNLVRREYLGMALGPLLYLKGRLRRPRRVASAGRVTSAAASGR
jgi:GT2 family glycosyltransferase